MSATIEHLIQDLKDPIKEVDHIRKGLKTNLIEFFLAKADLPLKDILERLKIPASTYFARKKSRKALDSHATEKFIRLISIVLMASSILGQAETKNWLYHEIPALGNEIPLNLLDTETGHRLVEQALLHVKYGIYG